MEEVYVSPDGVEQTVYTESEKFRLKYRGWKPKESAQPDDSDQSATPPVSEANRPPKLPRAPRKTPKKSASE